MRTIYNTTGIVVIALIMAACGSSVKEEKGNLNDKKVELQKLRDEQTSLNAKITKLEAEISSLDTSSGRADNVKLVGVAPLTSERFAHFIDIQGKVESENIAYVTPRGMGGQVRSLHVRQGDNVRKGQLLLTLDDAVAKQQIEQVQIQLDLAKSLYERRKNLWDQRIGTEVELLQAKNNVDNLEKQIELLREQLDMTKVTAQISGVADMVNIKVGEFFSPQSATQLGIRIVNTSNLKVRAEVPENYLGRVQEGTPVQVSLPDINRNLSSTVSVKGRTIDPSTRSFYIEARLPSSSDLRPNQIALLKIQDYVAGNAIAIPVNTLQNDEDGKYVMLSVRENGKQIARKRQVQIGELYGSNLEVKAGLQQGDTLITEGFQGLYDGQPIATTSR